MRRYLPFLIVAAVGLLTLGTGTMLAGMRTGIDAALKAKSPP